MGDRLVSETEGREKKKKQRDTRDTRDKREIDRSTRVLLMICCLTICVALGSLLIHSLVIIRASISSERLLRRPATAKLFLGFGGGYDPAGGLTRP
jgi:hypothetical protein